MNQTQDIMKNRPKLSPSMTPQRFQEIRAIFESVVSRPEAERFSTLLLLRNRDPELADEVESLIAAYDRRASFIERPAAQVNKDFASSNAADLEGCLIGPYQLLQIVGEGGMGQVWRAKQTRPVQRTVALKLIRWVWTRTKSYGASNRNGSTLLRWIIPQSPRSSKRAAQRQAARISRWSMWTACQSPSIAIGTS
jgi:hypothetical protein